LDPIVLPCKRFTIGVENGQALTPRTMMTTEKELKEMLKNAVHFGHAAGKWNPKMKPFIYGQKQGVHIFDLNQTAQALDNALDFLKKSATAGKVILFVSTKQQATELVKEAAKACKMPYVTQKWVPGLLTNFKTIKQRIKYLKQLKQEEKSGEMEKYTKKEISKLKKTINKLELSLGGVEDLEKTPDILLVFDVNRDKIAVKEGVKSGVKIIGITDSNADPSDIDYPIPANDDAIKSLKYLVEKFQSAICEKK